MQQEDDLRGLAKTMDFMRALSILFVVINIYWFCYGQIREWGINIGVVDRILLNFDRTAGLFRNILWTKLFAVVFLALSCLGTKGVKEEKITWRKITASLATGGVLFFFNWWLLDLPLTAMANAAFYILTLSAGYICLLMGGVWMSRLLKNNLMDDPFNNENESFQQETRLIENEYSINLPTKFYYNKQWNNGFANVVNPQRACICMGSPGSGKSYCVVNQFIKQQIEKGYTQYIYDYKFPDLSEIAYNHLLNHQKGYKKIPTFYVINFDDPRRSHRCNPIHPDFMTDISDAYESAYTIMLNLNRSWVQKQGDFFVESPIILFAAVIWFLRIYDNGRYCTFPHAIEFLNKRYEDIFPILTSYPELENYLSPFMDAWLGGAQDQLQRLVHTGLYLSGRNLARLETVGDVIAHAQVREDGVVLEHHADVALMSGHVVDALVAEIEVAALDGVKARYHAQKRGLAAAGRAEQREEFALADVQRNAVECGEVAVALDGVLDDYLIAHVVSSVYV